MSRRIQHMFDDNQNPYASPKLLNDRHFATVKLGTGEIRVSCKYRSWWSRTIVLEGLVNAEIRYESWGVGERVYVNGQLAARTPLFTPHMELVTPHIDFEIDSPAGNLDAAIDVRASYTLLGRITKFVCTVSDCVVYA